MAPTFRKTLPLDFSDILHAHIHNVNDRGEVGFIRLYNDTNGRITHAEADLTDMHYTKMLINDARILEIFGENGDSINMAKLGPSPALRLDILEDEDMSFSEVVTGVLVQPGYVPSEARLSVSNQQHVPVIPPPQTGRKIAPIPFPFPDIHINNLGGGNVGPVKIHRDSDGRITHAQAELFHAPWKVMLITSPRILLIFGQRGDTINLDLLHPWPIFHLVDLAPEEHVVGVLKDVTNDPAKGYLGRKAKQQQMQMKSGQGQLGEQHQEQRLASGHLQRGNEPAGVLATGFQVSTGRRVPNQSPKTRPAPSRTRTPLTAAPAAPSNAPDPPTTLLTPAPVIPKAPVAPRQARGVDARTARSKVVELKVPAGSLSQFTPSQAITTASAPTRAPAPAPAQASTAPVNDPQMAAIKSQINAILSPADQQKYAHTVDKLSYACLKGGKKTRDRVDKNLQDIIDSGGDNRRQLAQLHNQYAGLHNPGKRTPHQLPVFDLGDCKLIPRTA
ncbi:hypothetical protein BU26DRAFT_569781 [Trematosphaeria pertusa]|uniref:Uncharacterized protein n=1 Tax=Trematosphaeria pertusa TaxID=390896 RepID=A0A6A6I0T1_9PLEO|nr:uncharacterized protein BU26DRAFT_569781 [Trematosphaeria pertusa]KAF2243886.1 hypothetical protein BU26DRAFT_569781 [Trematosphaeria pertusa]